MTETNIEIKVNFKTWFAAFQSTFFNVFLIILPFISSLTNWVMNELSVFPDTNNNIN